MQGFIKCVNSKYEIKYLKKDDELLKSGEYVNILKKYITVKDINNNTLVVFDNDIRLITGELFPVSSKHITNCGIHGRQQIAYYKMISKVQIPEEYKVYCPKCKDYYLSETYNPQESDKLKCIIALNKMHFNCSNQQTPKYFKNYMPQFFKIIDAVKLNNDDLLFSDKIYLLKNNISEAPICSVKGCNEKCKILTRPGYGFKINCENHLYCNFSSKGENEIYDFIVSNYSGIIEKNYRKFGNNELDIYIPELNLGIEFNGLFWHSDKFVNKTKHFDKFIYFKDLGIKIITVWEDQWNVKSDIVKSILLNAINKITNKINARNCEIRQVKKLEKSLFLDINHIQGNCISSINMGLYLNNELISLMSLGKRRSILSQKHKDNEYEMLRFCSKLGYNVRGGGSKLFKNFVELYNPSIVISYSNLDIGIGGLYKILQFENLGFTNINYWWSDGKKRFHRSGFMKHKLVKSGADPNKTEDEIMKERKYMKIWGVGNNKWIWTKTKQKEIEK